MWDCGGEIEEERVVLVVADKLQGLGRNQVRGVIPASVAVILTALLGVGPGGEFLVSRELWVVQGDPPIIVPEVSRVIVVGDPLAVKAVEAVKALPERISGAAWPPQSPLAEGPGDIASFRSSLGRVNVSAGMGNCPSGLTSLLSRINACPGCNPVMRTHRDGAQTALPE